MKAARLLVLAVALLPTVGVVWGDDAVPEGGPARDHGAPATTESDRPMRRPAGRLSRMGPVDAVSQSALFASLDDLTAVRPYQGWRNSASRGEAEAVAYVRARLAAMTHLVDLGMEIEEQPFHTPHGTEFWQTCLELTIGGVISEVPVDGIPGSPYDLEEAMQVDTDGAVNDSDSDPIVVEGEPVLVRTVDDLAALTSADVYGRIVFADYALFDSYLPDGGNTSWNASELLDLRPAGIVLVTRFSDVFGDSHGTVATDLSIFTFLEALPPILVLRLEDTAFERDPWDGLASVESARMTLDVDVFSPGNTRNLIARIPGQDPSRAMILSGHIDSPNNPGALDDGSGVVTVLEVARVLDRTGAVPPVDLYLVWYGSHERGMYGSSTFVSTHQELLDRTIAMFQVDCLSVPLEGLTFDLYLATWSYDEFGDSSVRWPGYVSQLGDEMGIQAIPLDALGLFSDNSNYSGFDVPNLDLISMDPSEGFETHYDGFLHCPYDTAELARREGDALEDMARLALAAVLRTGLDSPQLRVTPAPDGRVVFVASHTESPHMSPTALTDLGMAMSWEGLDVDLVPFGQAVAEADLLDADMVVVLPVHDYPSTDGDVELYDVGWSTDEVDVLQGYVAEGGLLVITNSRRRLSYYNDTGEVNEDWSDMNDLAQRFGVEFMIGSFPGSSATVHGNSPLLDGVSELQFGWRSAMSFELASGGEVLATVGLSNVMAIVPFGGAGGEVLVVGDLAMLGNNGREPSNRVFWRNLASYARTR